MNPVQILGVKLVGVTAENGKKLLITVVFIIAVVLLGRLLRWLASAIFPGRRNERFEFWTKQGIRLATAVIVILGFVSIWFDQPSRLATAFGLLTAGVAFALQKVITAIAGYFVLLRGKTFNVGDRIQMGGVRGDVIALDFIQTTIMEMGEPPAVQAAEPAMWVQARQYTGRIVTVTNDKIFDQPVYNFTREFPYLWEEMHIPIGYNSDRKAAEQVLLEVAARHTVKISDMSEEALKEMERRYLMKRAELKPRVFWRLTDNWVELSIRFIALDYGVRDLKDKMSRDIMEAFDKAKIGIASGTYAVVEFPPVRIEAWPDEKIQPGKSS
jgi:small-conductance mechanosensitive channel